MFGIVVKRIANIYNSGVGFLHIYSPTAQDVVIFINDSTKRFGNSLVRCIFSAKSNITVVIVVYPQYWRYILKHRINFGFHLCNWQMQHAVGIAAAVAAPAVEHLSVGHCGDGQYYGFA